MMHRQGRVTGSAIFAGFLLFMLLAPARAQENAVVTGTVTDPSGAVIPNVKLTLTNTATGQTRQTVSNTSGFTSSPISAWERFP
jgi:hypothetical protein